MRDVERGQQVAGAFDVVLFVLLNPASGDAVRGGEHGVEHRFRTRNAIGQNRRGIADARTQFEHVDAPELLLEDVDRTRRRMHATGRQFEQGRLARTIGSEHRPVLAFGDGQGEIVEEEIGPPAHGHRIQIQDFTHILRLYRRRAVYPGSTWTSRPTHCC